MKTISLPANIFENDALVAAAARFGAGADSCALRLYFAVCEKGYYLHWDECQAWKFLRFLPKAIGIEEIDIFVEKLAEWGFFDYEMFKNCGVLTNLDIQRHYFRAPSRRQNLDKLPFVLSEIKQKYSPAGADTENLSGHHAGLNHLVAPNQQTILNLIKLINFFNLGDSSPNHNHAYPASEIIAFPCSSGSDCGPILPRAGP